LILELRLVEDRQSFHLIDNELSDGHTRTKEDAGWTEVDHFQGERPTPAGVDSGGREVDEQPNTSPTALALDSGGQAGVRFSVDRMVDRQRYLFARLG
jgi:hypothetical protein